MPSTPGICVRRSALGPPFADTPTPSVGRAYLSPPRISQRFSFHAVGADAHIGPCRHFRKGQYPTSCRRHSFPPKHGDKTQINGNQPPKHGGKASINRTLPPCFCISSDGPPILSVGRAALSPPQITQCLSFHAVGADALHRPVQAFPKGPIPNILLQALLGPSRGGVS